MFLPGAGHNRTSWRALAQPAYPAIVLNTPFSFLLRHSYPRMLGEKYPNRKLWGCRLRLHRLSQTPPPRTLHTPLSGRVREGGSGPLLRGQGTRRSGHRETTVELCHLRPGPICLWYLPPFLLVHSDSPCPVTALVRTTPPSFPLSPSPLLPPASCPLPSAPCLLPSVSCLLPPVSCLLPPACFLLPLSSCFLPTAPCPCLPSVAPAYTLQLPDSCPQPWRITECQNWRELRGHLVSPSFLDGHTES